MEAEDLLAAVWPGLAACQDNAPAGPGRRARPRAGPPDGHDCLHEGLSVEGLVELLVAGRVRRIACTRWSRPSRRHRPRHLERSPVHVSRRRAPRGAAHACALRPWPGCLGPDGLPVPAKELAALDAEAVAAGAGPGPPALRNADELHDLLLSLVAVAPVAEWHAVVRRPGGRRSRVLAAGAGWRPSAAPRPKPSAPTTTRPRTASPGTCNWPAR